MDLRDEWAENAKTRVAITTSTLTSLISDEAYHPADGGSWSSKFSSNQVTLLAVARIRVNEWLHLDKFKTDN